MAILTGDLRTALVAAGAPEELANKAAAEATTRGCLAGVETRLSVPTWMAGAVVALCMTILFRAFH